MTASLHAFFFQLLVSPDLRLRLLRHTLLWATALYVIAESFYFLAGTVVDKSHNSVIHYFILSTLLFGGLTVSGYFIITTLIHRFILLQFRPWWFILSLIGFHILDAEIVLLHFELLTHFFPLSSLPRFYTAYAQYMAELPFWKAPIDPIIVVFFSCSFHYNYILYVTGFKVFKDFFIIQLRQTELQRENLRLEFDFLKAQVNPHFLFNTLNNIYSFSVQAPERVGETVLKLADLMRYTLYDTSEELVRLSKELNFLESYLDLQRIRHDDHVDIEFIVTGDPDIKRIPPLLFIIFVENAFKHGIQTSAQPSWVKIHISIFSNSLNLFVSNSIPLHKSSSPAGIGLQNVRKRLDYLYPQRYQLRIDPQPTQFTIQLTLNLHE